jgi:hypothetical protein
MFEAVAALRKANVPPYRCICGREWYFSMPDGWKVGDNVLFYCDCGTTNKRAR